MVKERPILFNAPMVRAILNDRKYQTRRIIKPQPPEHAIEVFDWQHHNLGESGCYYDDMDGLHFHCKRPYGNVGDLLWVRETWAPMSTFDPSPETGAIYRADKHPSQRVIPVKWSPSIHMPRWASRITLEITGVSIERLHIISPDDVAAEGVEFDMPELTVQFGVDVEARYCMSKLWESINGEGSWNLNPWVWVISFERVTS
jgi:hypothetical protein